MKRLFLAKDKMFPVPMTDYEFAVKCQDLIMKRMFIEGEKWLSGLVKNAPPMTLTLSDGRKIHYKKGMKAVNPPADWFCEKPDDP